MSSDIEDLRREIDIVDVISEYLNLERVGSNYRTNCPFHPDRTPSFYVSPSKQIFKCFGCGVGGDAIKFVSLYENISYFEAALELAKKYGKTLDLKKISKDERIFLAIDRASDFYRESLLKNEKVAEYLKDRGIDGKTVKRFGLGFAPSSEELVRVLRQDGFLEDYLKTKNLIKLGEKAYRDLFSRRVVIPIRDPRGRIIGFGGRRLKEDNTPKYINSPDSEVFKKGKNLFALYESKDYIKEDGYAILVEGYFDVLKLFSEGIRNVVAPLGTALTYEQAELLSKYTKKVYILYDGDDAGRKAMKSAIPHLLKAGLEVYPIYLPEGYDPDEFVREFGRESLKELINSSPDLFENLVIQCKEKKENRKKIVKEFKFFLSFIEDYSLRFEVASKFYKDLNYSLNDLLDLQGIKKISDRKEKDFSFKEKVIIKGLLIFKENINLDEIKLREEVKDLCKKALNGEEYELPKEIISFECDNFEKVFRDTLERLRYEKYRKTKRNKKKVFKSN